jgi:uncharacterized protein DUF6600
MKTWPGGIGIVLIVCAAAIACVTYQYPPGSSRPAPTEVAPAGGSDQPFYDDLAPYGRWVYVSGPGWVWSPYGVQAGWRPYQLGHWVFTDYGWTWASDEDWGWAVYHYGRWHQDSSYGWVWVPGTEWGPAWVAWNEGGGYVGWAPLPWQVRVQAGVGLDWASINVTISPNWWCFTSTRYLVDPGLRTHIVPPARNVTLIQVTKNVTNYTYIDNRIVNQGVKVEHIGRAVGHTIPRYRVAETDAPESMRGGKVRGEDFVVFRPDPDRGRRSRGRPDPPGHDGRDRARDFRHAAEQAGQGQPPAETPPAPGAGQPDSNPPAATAQPEPNPPAPARPSSNERGRNRGRKFFDEMMGRPSPRRSPQGAAQAPPAPPQNGSTGAPPAETRPGNPAPDDQHGVTTPPTAPAPPAAPVAKENSRDKAKSGRDATTRGRKPKPDAPKTEGSDDDKTKKDKPDSEH